MYKLYSNIRVDHYLSPYRPKRKNHFLTLPSAIWYCMTNYQVLCSIKNICRHFIFKLLLYVVLLLILILIHLHPLLQIFTPSPPSSLDCQTLLQSTSPSPCTYCCPWHLIYFPEPSIYPPPLISPPPGDCTNLPWTWCRPLIYSPKPPNFPLLYYSS